LSKEKYQTKTQLLLEILLDDAKEDLYLSNQRMEYFIKDNDLETLKIERESNLEYKRKIEHIKELIKYEQNSYSSSPCFVDVGYINRDGSRVDYYDYESDLL
jgi:hypothetical protein